MKYLAHVYRRRAPARLTATITLDRTTTGPGPSVEVEVAVSGEVHPAEKPERDPGGNIVQPPEDAAVELDDGLDLRTEDEKDRARDALWEEHERQQDKAGAQQEDAWDAERERQRMEVGHGG